jgi:outer membrane protein assembly factor BamA
MLYNYAIIHQIVNRKIVKNLYAGLGYHLDIYWDIRDEFLELDTIPVQLTPHYAYSEVYDFNSVDYMLSGLSLNFLYDSRDNQVNPYKGHYANVRYRYNPTFLGSDRNSSSLWVEYRTYIGLSKKTPRHLIGFWFIGSFILSGYQPYLTLMAIGEDKKARSGRGYIAGRYRGEDILYAEAEYRFPILCSGILGGVIFLNATTASNIASDVHLFEYVRPAIGAGLRFLINKNTRLNLNIDFGFGIDSRGFYFSGTETF